MQAVAQPHLERRDLQLGKAVPIGGERGHLDPDRAQVVYETTAAPIDQEQEVAFNWNGLEFHIPLEPTAAAAQECPELATVKPEDSWSLEEIII